MKATTFEFDLRITSVDKDSVLENLKQRLLAIQDVNSIEEKRTRYNTSLLIRVSFKSNDDAMKLHGKIVKTIRNCPEIVVSQVGTTLTDIF